MSTRFLVLYWFDRQEDRDEAPRVGIAVPRKVGGAVVRNKVKRRLREAWRAQVERIPSGRDYVLVARPGLAESSDSQGGDWLVERVGEALRKATP